MQHIYKADNVVVVVFIISCCGQEISLSCYMTPGIVLQVVYGIVLNVVDRRRICPPVYAVVAFACHHSQGSCRVLFSFGCLSVCFLSAGSKEELFSSSNNKKRYHCGVRCVTVMSLNARSFLRRYKRLLSQPAWSIPTQTPPTFKFRRALRGPVTSMPTRCRARCSVADEYPAWCRSQRGRRPGCVRTLYLLPFRPLRRLSCHHLFRT